MGQKLHALMFPRFAFGHFTPYLHLANKLAEKGHRVTFLLPTKAKKQLEPLNLFPDSIVLHPITIPHVDGLPDGAETSSDIPITLWKFLIVAIDRTRDQVEVAVRASRPDLILFDYAYWVPEVAKENGVKSMMYNVISATCIAHDLVPGGGFGVPPPGYPSSKLLFRAHDAHVMSSFSVYYKRFYDRFTTSLTNCDFISVRTCEEIEVQKNVLLTGPMLPELDRSQPLEDKWNHWLSGFGPGSVQPLILAHPSVGCFVSHCGFGSMWESLISDCQIVLIPYLADQVLVLTDELEVAVEVQREETGWFSKENLSVAVNSVMDKDSEIGSQVRKNHSKLKELVVSPGLLTGYTDKFVETLENLLKDPKLQ
ncbi:hypothetical protein HID58_047912 [Brassica napus]|uniref:Glycosyltransferase n=1 Tax=Brassica napus TaxID=3708 RepID=A0ABQ8B0N0_BRANA|nr:hypothetical protein HID58_047912 [Brassica napus]